MKNTYLFASLIVFVLYPAILQAQVPSKDTIVPARGNVKKQFEDIKKEKVILHSDSSDNEPKKSPQIDTTTLNKYGDLLNDDPKYNKRYPLWKPAVQVVGENVLLNLLDRSVLNLEFARVDMHTWKRTTSAGFPWGNGWEWDQDRFGNNFQLGQMAMLVGGFQYYDYFDTKAFELSTIAFGGGVFQNWP